MVKILPPGMKHGEKADVGTQMLRVGGNLQQGFGRRPEEDTVNHPRVLESEGSDRLGHGEDDVKVIDGQKFGGLLLKPRRPGCSLTFGAVAVTAGTVKNLPMTASIALLNVAAEGGGCRAVLKARTAVADSKDLSEI